MAPPSSPVATVTVVLPATPHALMTVSRETLVSSPISSYRASKTLLARFSQSGRQERRRCVQARFGSSRHEDAVGHARVEMHVVVLALTGCFAGICFRHDIDTSDVQLWMATLVIQAIPYAAAVGMAIISARNNQ